MAVHCGLDLIELERMKKALSMRGESFMNKVYTSNEKTFCEGRGKASLQSYAARFCGKEAVAKALGTGISKGITFLDIEITVDDNGKPYVTLYNEAKRVYDAMGGKSIDISLTHTRDYAAAQAVILS